MAIDTETRRRSVTGYTGALLLPLADGTIGATDREHVVGLYSGITPGAPLAIPAHRIFTPGATASYIPDSVGGTHTPKSVPTWTPGKT